MSTSNGDDGPIPAASDPSHEEAVKEERSNGHNGSMALTPLFFGNLSPNYSTDQITQVFENPLSFESLRNHANAATFSTIPVDRIDVKRGYCFVFLKDATSLQEKERIEAFVKDIHGISVPRVSNAIRIEFARGDGRVKRKEDERRKNIAPSDTLFVVNFHEETTKREDLEMLFEPFGKLLRIDLKRNYAFVQFQSIAEATAAKQATNGGKLDQSVLTVEYVAQQRDRDERHARGPPESRRPDDRSGRHYDHRGMRYDDRGRDADRYHPNNYPPSSRYANDDPYYRSSSAYPPPDDRRLVDDRRRGGGMDDPPPYSSRGRDSSPPPSSSYNSRRRPSSRSRSPPPPGSGYYRRGSSPPRRYPPDDDDYPPPRRGGEYPHSRGRSPPPASRSDYAPDRYRSERDHHRGYRG